MLLRVICMEDLLRDGLDVVGAGLLALAPRARKPTARPTQGGTMVPGTGRTASGPTLRPDARVLSQKSVVCVE
jgi:hypothetical protein